MRINGLLRPWVSENNMEEHGIAVVEDFSLFVDSIRQLVFRLFGTANIQMKHPKETRVPHPEELPASLHKPALLTTEETDPAGSFPTRQWGPFSLLQLCKSLWNLTPLPLSPVSNPFMLDCHMFLPCRVWLPSSGSWHSHPSHWYRVWLWQPFPETPWIKVTSLDSCSALKTNTYYLLIKLGFRASFWLWQLTTSF